jgi:hypothetical protein
VGVLAPSVAGADRCPDINLSVVPIVPRYGGGPDIPADRYPLRPANEKPSWVDLQDCQDDIHLQFTVLESGLPCFDNIQVWAGTVDCTQAAARQSNSGQAHCWPVDATGAFAMAESTTGDIRARDIVGPMDSPEPPATYTPAGANACQSLLASGPSTCKSVPLSLYFMAVQPDGLTVDGTSARYDFGAETGPFCGSTSADAGGSDTGSTDAAHAARDADDAASEDSEPPIVRGGCRMSPGRLPQGAASVWLALMGLAMARRRSKSAG